MTRLGSTTTYQHPFNDTYSEEPTDQDAVVLARALAHWCSAYPERTVKEIIEDILTCNGASTVQMTRDECVVIAQACGASC